MTTVDPEGKSIKVLKAQGLAPTATANCVRTTAI